MTVGDHITIDWEAVIPDSTCLTVYPIGTNDYGVAKAQPEESAEQGSNGKQEMKFVAPASGNLILDFAATKLFSGCTSCAGPYAFTSKLQHSLLVNLAPPPSVPTNGVISATVTQNTATPVPDGLVFWLLIRWYESGEKKVVQTTGISAGGVVSFQLALPVSAAGHNLKVSAGRSEDGSYVETLSNPVTIMAAYPLTTPPRRRHRHRHRRHRHHHHHHHRHRG